MNVRQISISEFKARCTEEIREVEKGNVILQITRHGKPVAIVEPSKAQNAAPLAEWLGSGRGSVALLRDEALTSPTMAWYEDVEDVWTPLTADQHAARQDIRPAMSWEQFMGDGTQEEWEGFDEALEEWRKEPVRFDENLA